MSLRSLTTNRRKRASVWPRLRRVHAVASSVAVLAAVVTGAALTQVQADTQAQRSDSWIGGYQSGKTFVPLTVAGKADAARAYLLLENSRELVLGGWRIEGDRLTFSMPAPSGTLVFSGTISDGVARGTVRLGNTDAPFHLVNLHEVSGATLDRVAGTYAFDNRRHVLIRRLGVVLKYEDSETGRFGILAPVRDRTFIGGPGQMMFNP